MQRHIRNKLTALVYGSYAGLSFVCIIILLYLCRRPITNGANLIAMMLQCNIKEKTSEPIPNVRYHRRKESENYATITRLRHETPVPVPRNFNERRRSSSPNIDPAVDHHSPTPEVSIQPTQTSRSLPTSTFTISAPPTNNPQAVETPEYPTSTGVATTACQPQVFYKQNIKLPVRRLQPI